jgi:sugar/nucleoside kinase (ribokinase family)
MSQPPSSPPSSVATVVIGGTIAIDHVKTPEAEAANLLGGSAAYAALAASFFCRPVGLIGIIGRDFPQPHLDMLESHGVALGGVERSEHESFTWSGEYHANMNERTTHRVGLNVLENWRVKVPGSAAAASIVVLANMSPDNQLEMLGQCGIIGEGSQIADGGSMISSSLPSNIQNPKSKISPSASRFVIADTMDLWIEIANERLHEVLPHLDLFVLNEGEARELAGTSNLVQAGRALLAKGPRHVVIKLGEFGAMLFSAADAVPQNGGSGIEDGGSADPGPAVASPLPSKIQNPKSKIASASEPTIFRCAAWPLDAVADPTGAGDTFLGAVAGFLAAQGPPPYAAPALRQAIIQGSILASFTCEDFSTRRLESLQPADLDARLQAFRQATEW